LKVLHLELTHLLNPEPLSYLESLSVLNVKDNYLGDIESFQFFLRSLKALTNLDVRGNPIQRAHKFHDSIIILLPKIGKHLFSLTLTL